jgi:hypothetical protein
VGRQQANRQEFCPRPFRPAFLSKNTAHFVWEMAHPVDNPVLICSLRIMCDTRNHCVHDFDPTDVGEYVEGRVFRVWVFWGVVGLRWQWDWRVSRGRFCGLGVCSGSQFVVDPPKMGLWDI